tara:strand:+ start:167 stop:517 length:351 start_codon:yes stop_codon:yes gene_type:complete
MSVTDIIYRSEVAKKAKKETMANIVHGLYERIDTMWREIQDSDHDDVTQVDLLKAFIIAVMMNAEHMGESDEIYLVTQLGVLMGYDFMRMAEQGQSSTDAVANPDEYKKPKPSNLN